MTKRRHRLDNRFKLHSKHHSHNHFNQRHYKKHSPINSLFYKINRFVRRYPILSAVFSIIISIILFRFAWIGNLNKFSEFRIWIFLASIIFFIVGIIAIRVWMKNNVSNFNTQHNIGWRNR